MTALQISDELRNFFTSEEKVRAALAEADTKTLLGLAQKIDAEIMGPATQRSAVLTNCARCGGRHEEIDWRKFTRPCGDDTHWALCPTTREPILMRIQENPDD